MMRSLWIAKTGMEVQQTHIDVISNNLANVSTTGYKRGRAEFEDLLYQQLRPAGGQTTQQSQLPTGLQMGLGARTVGTSKTFEQGSLQESGNALDIAINGSGFFQVTMPDGSTAYTRDGTFHLDSQGQVVTGSGYLVQGFPPFSAQTRQIIVANDGTISSLEGNSTTPQTVGQLQLANFINAAGLKAVGENLFQETLASGTATAGNPGLNGMGLLNQGFLETSNVNVTEELINMIQAQRAFEINSRTIQASDQMLQRLTQL